MANPRNRLRNIKVRLEMKNRFKGREMNPGELHGKADDLKTRIINEINSMSVRCSGHPMEALRKRLSMEGVLTAKDLRRTPDGAKVKVSGLTVIIHMPPTKSGKRVLFITLEDETGLIDIASFPDSQKESAKAILTSEALTLYGRLQRRGKNGRSISVVAEGHLPHLSGSLLELLEKS
jgi:error-prone DNA polymerase